MRHPIPCASRSLLSVTLALASVTPSPAAPPVLGQTTASTFPSRVLITNDNGIDDPKLVALARAFSERAETWVVAPAEDRSGGGVHLTMVRAGSVRAERRDLGPGIRAYAVEGYPGDAVLVAVLGLMKDSLPDLIVSGINGGPNLGGEWLYSGTVGAARLGALGGFPAIAVSGLLRDEQEGASEAAAEWVVRFAASPMVQQLEPLEYLTVSFPPETPDGVRGVRITDRAPFTVAPRLREQADGHWQIIGLDTLQTAPEAGSDLLGWREGYISVVPMRIDEVDYARLAHWRSTETGLPEWRSR